MLCTSLRYRAEEFVAWPRPISQFRAGHATAIPLVHPWANRLSRWGYPGVDLRGLPLPTDKNGLPIHGNLLGAAFTVTRTTEDRIVAELAYDDPRAFPFPHTVIVDARVHPERGLTITTEVRPTGTQAVPISFGWHPYIRLPNAPRREWMLHWPACEHLEVDEHTIPTGRRTHQDPTVVALARATFDDHYALGRHRQFSISARNTALTLRFDAHYPYAQLFVPPRRAMLSIEPMTAEIDALNRGGAPMVEPGDRFRASFSIVRSTTSSRRRASTRRAAL
jgi:galactose mutarotase-like enzyme